VKQEFSSQTDVTVRVQASPIEYAVEVGDGLLARAGELVQRALGDTSPPSVRIALIGNRRVFSLYAAQVRASLEAAGYKVNEILIGDGERFKTLSTAARVLDRLAVLGFERNDVVMALGGGVTGDLAGFVAATYLRGVSFVNLPTTLLAQVDASVGGKTGVNTTHAKNQIGVFHHPRLVIADTDTLATLDRRDLTAGWCEAVKHGAAGDRALFDETRRYLARVRESTQPRQRAASNALESSSDKDALAALLRRHIGFKAAIVGGDERESVARTDSRSRRILNFGHTVAHAIEAVTSYRRFRHGEAVGRGMIAAGAISSELGLLDDDGFTLLRETINLTGHLPPAADLDAEEIFHRLSSDKKSVNGSIQWVLLDSIGQARITDSQHIPPAVIRRAVHLALNHDS
jgi:3-dehydroquinate synthase